MNAEERVEELTLRRIDEGLSEAEEAELERLLSASPEAARRHVLLLEQEALLRVPPDDLDVARATIDRIAAGRRGRIEAGVARRIAGRPAGSASPWVFGPRFYAAAAAALLVLAGGVFTHSAWYLGREPESQEATILGRARVLPGTPAAFRVRVADGRTQEPIPGARIDARVVDREGTEVWTASFETGADGLALLEPSLPAGLPEGEYALAVTAVSSAGTSEVRRAIEVRRPVAILVTTDKPLYQPGQRMHLRALALSTEDLRPAAGRELVLAVADGEGNRVFKRCLTTSRHGIAHADFDLADQVNLGAYVVSATIGETASERTVRVERYVLPKFRVSLETDRGWYEPGDVVRGEVRALYTFGEPVRGAEVSLAASEFLEDFRPFGTLRGVTDAGGRWSFEVPLPDGFTGREIHGGDGRAHLEATVVDSAGHEQRRYADLAISAAPLRVAALPESGVLVAGVSNVVYLAVSTPDGRAVRARLRIEPIGEEVETDDVGLAAFSYVPAAGAPDLVVRATTEDGLEAEVPLHLPIEVRSGTVLLRTDRPVYRAGESLVATVLVSGGRGRVFVDAVKDRRTVLEKAVDVERGKAEVVLDLPDDLAGAVELHAYRFAEDGEIFGDARLVQVEAAGELVVETRLDRERYRPGETAKLEFLVRDAAGRPAAAALGVAGVDEAVFALEEARPGFERAWFLFQADRLRPRAEVHWHAPAGGSETARAAALALAELEPIERAKSSTLEEKAAAMAGEKWRYARNRDGFLALIPFALFALAALAAIGCSVQRMRSRPIGEAAGPLARTGRRIAWAWTLGLALPLAGFAAGGIVREGGVALVLASLGGLGAFGWFVAGLVAALGDPESHRVPLFRRSLGVLLAAWLLAGASIGAFIAASEASPDRLEAETIGGCLAAMGILWILVAGTFAAGSTALVRPRSFAGWSGVVAARVAIAASPLAVVFALVVVAVGGQSDKALSEELAPGLAEFESRWGVGAPAEPPAPGSPSTPSAPRVRRDFPETLFWRPELLTDDQGRATLEVELADSITTWRVSASAVGARGQLGGGSGELVVFQDFFVDLDVPVSLTQHDVVEVPVAIHNYLDEPQDVRLELEPAGWYRLDGPAGRTVEIGARAVAGVRFRIEVLEPGEHPLRVTARGTRLEDAVERRVRVVPDGERMEVVFNGRLSADRSVHELEIPPAAIEGGTDLFLKVYPGGFSEVVEGLDGIFRMPSGCFEQTSSSTYPNVLVLDYLRQAGRIAPEVELKAAGYVGQGYQRLVTFEVEGGGFSWFGQPPAHLVLTAYGLMEFADMARVHEVDPALLERTRRWLLSRQAIDGTWRPEPGGIAEGAIDAYQGRDLRTTAYVAWALASAGERGSGLGRALDHVAKRLPEASDAYTLALCANALLAGKAEGAEEALARLEDLAVREGDLVHWVGQGAGLTHSAGASFDIETTALAIQAFLASGRKIDLAHRGLAWLTGTKDAWGTWHSTQATIQSMRALLAASGGAVRLEGEVRVRVAVDGEAAGEVVVTPDTADVHHLLSLREHAGLGKRRIELAREGEGELAYQIVSVHHEPWKLEPAVADGLAIEVAYDDTDLEVGGRVKVRVRVAGRAPMAIVDLGIPPGFDLDPGALDRLVERGTIQRWDLAGGQAILYLAALDGELELEYELVARLPVRVKTPASRVYPFYEPELVAIAHPVQLTVR